MTRLTNHLIVISFDCLSALDFPILQELPHFQELLAHGSYCKNVESIYPSVTYPCHATIVTGKYPNRHGIINNTFLQPGRLSPDWFWQRTYIKGTTLYDAAKKAGLSTAALLWPVTAKAKLIIICLKFLLIDLGIIKLPSLFATVVPFSSSI